MRTTASSADSLPFEVQREMLDALFSRFTILIFGYIAHVFVLVVCWAATNDPIYFAIIPFLGFVLLFRWIVYKRYTKFRDRIRRSSRLAKWENLYIIGGSLACFGVGFTAAYTVIMAPSTIAPGLGMGLVGGTMISVVARNFSSHRNAKLMAYSCCVPLIGGFLYAGAFMGDILLTLTTVPVILIMTTSVTLSGNLFRLLIGALLASRKSEIGSQRFNAAVTSMPNGLIMVDGDNRIIVCNTQACQQLGIKDPQGMNVLAALLHQFTYAEPIMEILREQKVDQDDFDNSTFRTRDGRHLRFRSRPIEKIAGNKHKFTNDEWGGRQEGAYVVTIVDVTKKVQADQEITHLARFDGLTGIANRAHWESTSPRIVEAMERGSLVGLAVLDVDRFKLINDTLGHHVGDEVIAGVAKRIVSVEDPRLFAGRLGGDEFVVLIPDLRDVDEAIELFDRVFRAISCTYKIEGHDIEVRCSGGVIVKQAEDFNLHADMSRADMALYKVKRDPDRLWALFDHQLEHEYETSIRIKHDLRAAIEGGLLDVIYQPIFDITGTKIVSAEALCRWEHDDAGQIPPSQFIAMAEEIGVIGKLTNYVMRTACRDCMTWDENITVSVNLSALDLARDGVIDRIAGILADTGMDASRLCIEVTETVFVKDFEKTANTLRKLRAMGIKTSLDDFGTGYSSLSYMQKLPLNRVKIDRSFIVSIVEDHKSQQLFSLVVGLAKGLEFEVVVEGVENRAQLEYITKVPGVDMIQGYIFSKGLTNPEMITVSNQKRVPWSGSKGLRLV